MYKIDSRILGMVGTNCYLLCNMDIKECVVIDTADKPEEISRMIEECLLENEYIEKVVVENTEYKLGKLKAKVTVTTIYEEEISETYETEVAA